MNFKITYVLNDILYLSIKEPLISTFSTLTHTELLKACKVTNFRKKKIEKKITYFQIKKYNSHVNKTYIN